MKSVVSIRSLADAKNPASFSNRMRDRRFVRFESLTAGFARPLRILDIGGTTAFWERRGWAGRSDIQLTLVNLAAEPSAHANITSIAGDATRLTDYADQDFDIAFGDRALVLVGKPAGHGARGAASGSCLLGSNAELLVSGRAALPRRRMAVATRGGSSCAAASPPLRMARPLPGCRAGAASRP